MDGDTFAGLSVSFSVQVLDISEGGVLLQSSRPLSVGLRAPLRLSIGGQSFTSEVAVTRVSPSPGGAAYEIGAMFVAIGAAERQIIERFIRE